MAYIGKSPTIGNFQKCDAISVVNGQAAYTLQVNSVNVSPESVNHCLVSLNGILQAPTDSFTVSGSTLTFASNLSTGDVIDFVMILGNVLDLGVPSDATVTNAKTNFVSTSSAAGLQIKGDGTTDGTLQLNCSQNSHGIKLKSPSHSSAQSYTLTFPTTSPATDKFLKTDSSGNLSFADAGGGLNKLVTTTLGSDAAQIDFDSTYITSTYKNYYIVGHIKPANDNVFLNFRVMTGGTVQSGSSDYGSGAASSGGSSYTTSNTHAQIVMNHTEGGQASGEGVSFFMNLYNPLSTTFSTAVNGICTYENASGNEEGSFYSGQKRSVEANNGIRFLMNSGNIASGSYVTLYGIKD